MSKEEKKLRQQNKEKIKQEKAAAKAESKQEKRAVTEPARKSRFKGTRKAGEAAAESRR